MRTSYVYSTNIHNHNQHSLTSWARALSAAALKDVTGTHLFICMDWCAPNIYFVGHNKFILPTNYCVIYAALDAVPAGTRPIHHTSARWGVNAPVKLIADTCQPRRLHCGAPAFKTVRKAKTQQRMIRATEKCQSATAATVQQQQQHLR